MGFWINRAVYALLKTKPVRRNHALPIGMLAPVALPTLFSIKQYVRRVAQLSNTKMDDAESHYSQASGFRSVGVLSQVYPVAIVLIYAAPLFWNMGLLISNPSSQAAKSALWAMAENWPQTVLSLLVIHVTVRWLWLGLHAYFISKKLETSRA